MTQSAFSSGAFRFGLDRSRPRSRAGGCELARARAARRCASFQSRRGQRQAGKSDEIDALAVARAVVKDGSECFPAAYLDERAMEIRLLSDHRDQLVAERTRIQNRLRWHLLELCPELEAQLRRDELRSNVALERIARRLRRFGEEPRARVARKQLGQIRTLTREANALERELIGLIKAHRPQLLAERGLWRADGRDVDRPYRRRRALPPRRALRPPGRRGPDTGLLRAHRSSSPASRRRPTAQPRAAHDRDHEGADRSADTRLPGAQAGRGQDQA